MEMVRNTLWMAAFATSFLFIWANKHHWMRSVQDFIALGVGGFIIAATAGDVHIGRVMLSTVFMPDERTKSPGTFWMGVVVEGGFGIACLIGVLGDLLGFWRLWLGS